MKIFPAIIFFINIFAAITIPATSRAISPEEHLANQAQEQRAINLFSEVKCLICSGQSIEGSSSEFSYEMRKLIRQKIAQGKSDDEVRAELVKQFGDDVLLSSEKNFPVLFVTIFFALLLTFLFWRNFFRASRVD